MYPCVCCGHLTIPEQPGSYFICPICFWEDDVSQLRWPTMSGGANDVSLIEGQANFREFGSCKLRMTAHVRPPTDVEMVEPGWRPLDPRRDRFEAWGVSPVVDWPDYDWTVLYWWRPTYWRLDA
ncbi:hypothetical protein HLY00_2218 [Mycolicibacterium hippocampi]|uniref:Cysteine-rich CPCC domain-containing protein n=1 Tax=Mycolicibacterium hippocampi TaxID=659824 RepID=A0A850PVF3_9MYCO|nr:hypothetical protein [Mycolicibacterium hippocampi]